MTMFFKMGIWFMKKEKMNRMLFAGILLFLAMYVFLQPESFGENEIKAKYYEILSVMEPLYANHGQIDGQYFNREFTSKEDVLKYLSPYMTEEAANKLIEELFQESEKKLVYAGQFQEYLLQEYSQLTDNPQLNYYNIVKDTIFNPGLKLVMENQIAIKDDGQDIVLIIKEEPIHFYSDTYENLHYTRYGYPETAVVYVSLSFNEEDGNLLLSDFRVQTIYDEYSS